MNTIPLISYSDKLSVRPEETISFKVSSELKKPFKTSLFKSISADPNPMGIGITEKSASEFFKEREFESKEQRFFPGSYGITNKNLTISKEIDFKISLSIFPTLNKNSNQSIISAGKINLFLNSKSFLCFRFGEDILIIEKKIELKKWTFIEFGYETLQSKIFLRFNNFEKKITSKSKSINDRVLVAASKKNSKISNFFNGKIENPKIHNTKNNQDIAFWDFSKNISSTFVEDQSNLKLDLFLINFPMRASTSSNWNGTEMCWTHDPKQYCAIHFHEDDIYDFDWETSFSFTIPKNMPSGIYVMRFNCGEFEDAIPFFVCPPKNQITSSLCVVIPTFTYAVYGNHARPDYNENWQKLFKSWNAYKYNPAIYKNYGLSTYNFHSDGSGICHASFLRPLLNLRPGYITFGNGNCSGLRHFQADSHLISWLEDKGISYDIITDYELHNEGNSVILNYKAVMTTSHPEYHTIESLNAFQNYTDNGGNLIYLGGNGFYWKIALHSENNNIIEIRRAEDGIRAWASEPGEYYHAFDGKYGGLWRRNGRPPQLLAGVGFSAQGKFNGSYYIRKDFSKSNEWIFNNIQEKILGDFGFSGGGAAGFELDRADYNLGTPKNCSILAISEGHGDDFVLVPEEHLTHITNWPGKPLNELLRAEIVFFETPSGGKVVSAGSITFCGSLPFNNFKNNISQLLENVVNNFNN